MQIDGGSGDNLPSPTVCCSSWARLSTIPDFDSTSSGTSDRSNIFRRWKSEDRGGARASVIVEHNPLYCRREIWSVIGHGLLVAVSFQVLGKAIVRLIRNTIGRLKLISFVHVSCFITCQLYIRRHWYCDRYRSTHHPAATEYRLVLNGAGERWHWLRFVSSFCVQLINSIFEIYWRKIVTFSTRMNHASRWLWKLQNHVQLPEAIKWNFIDISPVHTDPSSASR